MEPGVYTVFCRKDKAKQRCTLLRSARVKRLLYSVRPVLVPLKPIGQLYGEVGAFADLPFGVIVLMGQTHSFECLEEPVQILRQELPAKETGSIPNKLILGNRVVHRALAGRIQLEIILTSVCRKVTVCGKLDRTAGEGVFRPDLWVRGTSGHSMSVAFVFPGQGSQVVGMGKSLAANFTAAHDVFDEVDTALDGKLSTVIFEGPDDTLMLTETPQTDLMAVSLAAFRVLEKEAGLKLKSDAQFVAGHSLGEYSALAAAGAFTVAEAARLLRTRGQAMQKAVPVGEGAMAALIGLEFDAASAVASQAAQ